MTEQRIGQLIQKRRSELNISQRSLDDAAGIGVVTLSAIETGKSSPRVDTLEAVCTVLGMTPSDVWGPPRASLDLSHAAIPGPLSAADGAVILARIAEITPAQRALLLAMLFSDRSLFDGYTLPDSFWDGLGEFQKAK